MNPLKLIEILKNHTVYIQTHNFPDPDAISCAFGLQEFLKYHGLESNLCYDGRIARLSAKKMLDTFGITMHPGMDVSNMNPNDYIILVDSQKNNANVTDFIGKEVACIDHHPIVTACDYRYSDIRQTGACASIIASYYKATNTPISPEAAAALAYGIKMDTADFTRGTTALDTEMLDFLFDHADWDLVESMYSNTLEYNDLRAYGAAIQNIEIHDSTGFAYIPFNCSPALIAIISDFILALDVVCVAVIYANNDEGIRFSVRSELKDIHAGDLISLALSDLGNGGGHPSMAGGMIPTENIPLLGNNMTSAINGRFLKAESVLRGK